ncbi:response regulator transcription factor [Slackia piriformis]|uniref:response regulator transcription factor n=1 Tax=Slackia piriformis TaxID=626934 RepID=UPI0026DB9F72|nr:response regulator transcription factor [Slackia piriformis]MDO5023426.1 response regulator transcription factor [Slackia piriformis]
MDMPYRILIVEDDESIARFTAEHLRDHGYEVVIENGARSPMASFDSFCPHLVLMDIGLPHHDGFTWCDAIRRKSACPIVFLSAQDSDSDQVLAMARGADDFIAKPFSLRVVTAKIEAVLRRAYGELSPTPQDCRTTSFSNCTLDRKRMRLETTDGSADLTRTEFAASALLFDHADEVVSRSMLLEEIWEEEAFVEANTLNVTISRIRKKLAAIGSHAEIKTVRNVGYRLCDDKDADHA